MTSHAFKEDIVPEFPGVTHVALTVTDLERSRPFYESLIGSPPVIDEDTGPFHHVVWLLGGSLVGIHYFPDTSGAVSHGCLRLPAPAINAVNTLALGTLVTITQ